MPAPFIVGTGDKTAYATHWPLNGTTRSSCFQVIIPMGSGPRHHIVQNSVLLGSVRPSLNPVLPKSPHQAIWRDIPIPDVTQPPAHSGEVSTHVREGDDRSAAQACAWVGRQGNR